MRASALTFPEAFHTPPRMSDWRGVSQLPRATGPKIGESFLGEPVKSAGFCIPLDLFVEAGRVKGFEPRPEFSQLIRGQFG